MITDDELEDIPADPDDAICFLVEALRQKVRQYGTDDRRTWDIEREYVNLLRGFAGEYHVNIHSHVTSDPPLSDSDFADYYHAFNVLVDQYVAAARIRMAMQRKRERVPLNAATKARISRHVQQIREILHRIDLPTDKKDQILLRLNRFAAAVDMEKTDTRRILDVILEVADTGDEMSKKLVDVRKHVEAITGFLAEARSWTDKLLGVTWSKSKEIEGPRKQLPAPAQDEDDDIPF